MKYAIVDYYNVRFLLTLKEEEDLIKFSYLQKRIEKGECLYMRDILSWCDGQKIEVKTNFRYLKRVSPIANIWNFYSYMRAKYAHMKSIVKSQKFENL